MPVALLWPIRWYGYKILDALVCLACDSIYTCIEFYVSISWSLLFILYHSHDQTIHFNFSICRNWQFHLLMGLAYPTINGQSCFFPHWCSMEWLGKPCIGQGILILNSETTEIRLWRLEHDSQEVIWDTPFRQDWSSRQLTRIAQTTRDTEYNCSLSFSWLSRKPLIVLQSQFWEISLAMQLECLYCLTVMGC